MTEKPYILEFVPQGRFVKVSAVDPETGTEAVIVGDAAAGRMELEKTAIRKLEYLLRRADKNG
jgi:hypothetical protein